MALRAFIALDLPEEAKDVLFRFVEKERVKYPQGKWVCKEHFHITLAFFPALPEHHVKDIQNLLEELSTSFPPYHAYLRELGTFPSWQRVRVLWMGLDEEGKRRTRNLAEAVFLGLRTMSIPCEEEKGEFVPHVTLARFKVPLRIERTSFSDWSPLPITIGEIGLFESILKPSGPVYRKLVYIPLKG